MSIVWKIINNLVWFFEFFSFFYIIYRRDFREVSKKRVMGISICIIVWISGLMLGVNWNDSMYIPFPVGLFLIYSILFLLFDINLLEGIVAAVAQWLVLCILESMVSIGVEHYELEKSISELLIMTILVILFWIFYFMIGRRIDSKMFRLPIRIWCLLDVIILVITAMMSFFTYMITEELSDSRTATMGSMLFAIGGTLICILLFVMIYYYNRTQEFRMQKEFAEVQNEQQREYFQRLLLKEEETRGFRHDIINDLLEIRNYYEKGEYQQLKSYLDSTLGVVQNISKGSYDVGNDIINTVLNYYLHAINDKLEIKVNGYIDECVSIEQRDLCVISANLIKNAVEAVDKLEKGKVVFNIEQGKQYLSIKVENTYDGQLTTDKNGNILSSKKDKKNHGIGIHNIKEIVNKYDGRYKVEMTEDIYCVTVFLKLS